MSEAKRIGIGKEYTLNTNHRSVVQKGNIGTSYLYALQLRNSAKDTYVLRGTPTDLTKAILILKSAAAGHTQTWEFSGQKNKWFIGTKQKKTWASQIALVDIKKNMGKAVSSNTEFPRLAYLNRAGKGVDYNGNTYTGDMFKRAEAAVSPGPNYDTFLLATVDIYGTGYFTLYNMAEINSAFSKLTDPNGYIDIGKINYKESFIIPKFVSLYKGNTKISAGIIDSIQGYDLDDAGNIYVTSQKSPLLGSDGKWITHHKEIVKIPANHRTDTSNWGHVNLSAWRGIDISGKHSEVESLQVLEEDHAYVTVAYHANVNGSNKTVLNKAYELSWSWK